MPSFAAALTALLEQRGLSQREFARRLDVSPAAVNDWCSGATKPTRANAARIEEELDVRPRGRLLGLLGYSAEVDDAVEPTLEDRILADDTISSADKHVLIRFLVLARADHLDRGGSGLRERLTRATGRDADPHDRPA